MMKRFLTILTFGTSCVAFGKPTCIGCGSALVAPRNWLVTSSGSLKLSNVSTTQGWTTLHPLVGETVDISRVGEVKILQVLPEEGLAFGKTLDGDNVTIVETRQE